MEFDALRLTLVIGSCHTRFTVNRDAYERARGDRPSWRIAAEAGIPAPYLSKIVASKVNPGVHIARRLADVLGCSLDTLWPPSAPTPTNPGPKPRHLRSVNPAAAALGSEGGKATSRRLSAAERTELGKRLAAARWGESQLPERGRWVVAARALRMAEAA